MIDVPERLGGVIDNNGLISLAWYIAEALPRGQGSRDDPVMLH